MKIDSPKRLSVEDFKDDEKELVEKIGICYNSFAESIYNDLDKQFNFPDIIDILSKAVLIPIIVNIIKGIMKDQ
jgi:hypothetical protein